MKAKLMIPVIFYLALIVSCGGHFARNSYRAGAISKSSYTIVLEGMGDLYKSGLIDEDVKVKAVEYGDLYMKAHNASIESLARYVEMGQESDKARYLRLAAEATNLLAKLLNYARPYLLENGKEVP